MNVKGKKGITLIALVITIIVLVIIAGVAINMTVGENGIIKRALQAREMQEAAEIKEKLELQQLDASISLGGEEITLDNYLKYLVDQGIIDENDIEDTQDSNAKTILVDDKYIYTVIKNEDGSIELVYEGKAGQLLPKIKDIQTTSSTNSITVKVEATRVDGGNYKFYIKDVASGEDYKKKETNKTGEYTFIALEQNKEYKIRVEVENQNGYVEQETGNIRTTTVEELTQADLEFEYNPNTWTNSQITVTVSAKEQIPTEYSLQTSKDAINWETTTSQTFTENGKMYVRLYDGTNGGNYAVAEVSKIDKTAPTITSSSRTATSISFVATDNASGIIGYKVTTDSTVPTIFDSCSNMLKLEKTITGLSQNTSYNIWVKDATGTVSEKTTVTTTTIAVTGVTLDKTSASLIVGNTTTVKATISPNDAYNKNIKWTSSNTSIATVSTSQTTSGTAITITAKAPGTANITATSVDGSKTATCSVTVSYPTLVSSVAVGDYVAYQPGTYSYTSTSAYNGYGNQVYTSNNNIKWRVISKNTSTGEVILISEGPISPDGASALQFTGAKAYLYNMEQLDRICAIYGHGTGADTSKSFTGYNGDEYSGKATYTITGSGARSINLTEINKYVGYTVTAGSSYSRSVQAPSLSASNKIASATTRTYTHTYYGYQASTYLSSSSMVYKLLFRNAANSANINYWISGKNIEVYDTSVRYFLTFCISNVENATISADYVGIGADTYFNEYSYSKTGVRPIVYLKKNIKTSGKNSSGQWVIVNN